MSLTDSDRNRRNILDSSWESIRLDATIVCAEIEEAQPFLDELVNPEPTIRIGAEDRHTQSFTRGTLNNRDVLIIVAGVGLVNAAAAATHALALFDPAIVICAGTTGGLHEDVEIGDIIVSSAATYHDADATAFGYLPGQIPGMPPAYVASESAMMKAQGLARQSARKVRVGGIVSGDSFITAKNVDTIRQRFPEALATDMETVAIAQICDSLGRSWVSIRSVSDLCGPKAHQDYHMETPRAAALSFESVRAFLAL